MLHEHLYSGDFQTALKLGLHHCPCEPILRMSQYYGFRSPNLGTQTHKTCLEDQAKNFEVVHFKR